MAALWRPRNMSELKLGLIFVAVALLAGAVLFQKQRVMVNLQSGDKIAADFSSQYRVEPFKSPVKISGVPIGAVTSIKRVSEGTTRMEFKVKRSSLDSMGTSPSAVIRPATLLGGNYFVEIIPGGVRGTFHGTIPKSRTKLPVELDQIAAALNTPAREGIRSSVSDLGQTLDDDGQKSIQDLTEHIPTTLRPAAAALNATRGTNPGVDLPQFVGGFESASRVLSEQDGQLDDSVRSLAELTNVLSDRSKDMNKTLDKMPKTLDSTEKMLRKLRKTLDTLESTSDDIRPSVKELDDLLDDLDPVLVEARPVIADLRVVAADARPVLKDLVPIIQNLTEMLNNLEGPTLDRINGPILTALNGSFNGTGLYEDPNRGQHPLYKEIAYTAANVDQANMADVNGDMVSFLAGSGPGSLFGLPISGEQVITNLLKSLGGLK
jgi:phospholipid/cholesterol/gamma-HCH transport system substrate-binding protein